MFKDSVGNTYKSLPSRPPVHSAKSSKANKEGKAGRSTRNGKPFGRNGDCGCITCRRFKPGSCN